MFDSALGGASQQLQAGDRTSALQLAPLALQYADAELAMAAAGATSAAVAHARAVHVLQWLLEVGCSGDSVHEDSGGSGGS